MPFASLYSHGFARVAACTADVYIADPRRNAESVIDISRRVSEDGVAVAVFPELCLTGYALDDLLGQDAVTVGAGVRDAAHAIEVGVVFFSLMFIGAGKYSVDKD